MRSNVLTLKLFGAPVLESDGVALVGRAAQGHRLAILAVLALAGGRPVGRDRLVALLWPESSAERARPQLSDALYLLRGGVGPDVVRTVGDDLMLHPDVTSDVGEFERSLHAGALEQAVALVAGPFLDGFHLAGAGEFARWADAERARLAEQQAGALGKLAEACERHADADGAVGWWRRLAALDPYNGRVALRLMRALEHAGDRAGAIRHARIHETMLREEFDADPDPELTAFAERLRAMPVTAGANASPPSVPRETTPVAAEPMPSAHEHDVAPSPADDARVPGPGAPRRRRIPAAVTVAALALVAAGAIGAFAATRRGETVAPAAPAPSAGRSLAVLPFVNMSPDPANGYFSDGLSEQVISALSRVAGLRVAARTSSFALRDARLDVRAIGDTLGVDAVLEGSVRREGARLRVTAQLIDAATGYHIWTGEYDRDAVGALAVQDEIASAIAAALELRFPVQTSLATRSAPPSLAAYDLYLRALHLRNELDADALRQATALLDSAIAMEPEFALAHSARASVVAPRMYFGQIGLDEGVRQMRSSIGRAFALDSTLGETHVALGILRLFFEWDWEGAEQSLRRAVALNPSDPHAWHHLANYLQAMGRGPEAVAARTTSVTLDPLNARTRAVLATDLLGVGRADDAAAEAGRAQRLDPMNPLLLGRGPSLPIVPRVAVTRGQPADAMQALLRVAALRDARMHEIDGIRDAFPQGGMVAVWRRWMAMDVRQSGAGMNPMRLALLHMMAGDTARTLDLLERAHAARDPGMIYVRADAMLAPLHGHPRFQRILAAMRLPRP